MLSSFLVASIDSATIQQYDSNFVGEGTNDLATTLLQVRRTLIYAVSYLVGTVWNNCENQMEVSVGVAKLLTSN